jgi:hypothetical protein
LEAQLQALRFDVHFNNHKWYRSEEALRDIGFGETLQSFSTSDYYRAFAEGFRRNYCSRECDMRTECDVETVAARTSTPVKSPEPSVEPAAPPVPDAPENPAVRPADAPTDPESTGNEPAGV